MKKSCLYFNKKCKCVSFIVHYKGLTLSWVNSYLLLVLLVCIQCHSTSTNIILCDLAENLLPSIKILYQVNCFTFTPLWVHFMPIVVHLLVIGCKLWILNQLKWSSYHSAGPLHEIQTDKKLFKDKMLHRKKHETINYIIFLNFNKSLFITRTWG